ncbi:MAG: hypothetical protein FD123_3996 [Bacteroidetes bacterium]|nr:MAG: hypothetical protein FD123_3996 [Bacteroidota bacterium]
MIRKAIVTLVLLCSGIPALQAQSQIKSFSEDPVKFIEELQSYFESAEKKEGKDYVEEFSKLYWITNKIDDYKKQYIYRNCNQMLKRRFKPTPEFRNYLNAVKSFVDNNLSGGSWNDWQICFDKLAAGKSNKYFADYLAMSETLFADNTFYKSQTTLWKADNANWMIICDSVPMVKFGSLTLKCLAKGDSSIIYNTSGTYFPSTGTWVGKNGKVNWRRVGIPEEELKAELKNYRITLKSGGYEADSAIFYNKNYFQGKPLLGKLSEKIVADASDKNASYPRFESYSQRYQIKSLFPNVDFEGGFTQVGARFIGSGNKENRAFVVFKRNNKDFLRLEGKSFVITKERLTCPDASVRFSLDKDSIFHPGLDFKYFIDSNKVVLYRSGDGATATPYYDSYHQVDIDVERIVWKTDEPRIILQTTPGSSLGEAQFQSSNYYRQYLYDKLQGMDAVHPLIRIRDFVKKNGDVRTFTVLQLASFWKITPENLRPALVPLSNAGFIMFDIPDDEITVKDKLFSYTLARAKQVDYDVLDFRSKVQPGTANASLNLLNNDLTIFGVKEVALSDSQNVVVFPAEDKLILKKNRNFTFQGSIMAGRFDYYGKQFLFDYDAFKLKLDNVDSVRIWVDGDKPDPNDPKGRPIQVKVKSVIENLNGELLIDLPANKSGLKPYAKYPTFTSNKESFVYYDRPTIHKSVYKRDDFYFKLDPFTIDSLDNFSNEGLKFLGTFKSAGIFPEMRDTLRLMPDYSLGFDRKSPPAGLANYGSKAKFNNTFHLSNQGLHGEGSIDYLTSHVESNDFLFFPDEVNGVAQVFDMKEQKGGKTEYPNVKGENVQLHYLPKRDNMQVTSKEKKFSMYDGSSSFGGTLTLTPQELSGNGLLEFATAEMDSKDMVFKQHVVDADTANFRLKALELAGLAFDTKNMNAHLDFEKREGEFKANGKGSIVEFPVNQYICYMDQFKWFMDKGEIELGGKPKPSQAEINIEGPEFISIHPKQDSLRFNAPRAKYDLKNYIISAEDVKKILVADAEIKPYKGDVIIEKNAHMKTLESAEITANAITRYHKLFNATVNIYAKKSYEAVADYAYIDENKGEQIIHFAKVTPDTSGQTYAEGSIADTAKFMLSPAFDYRGKVVLAANNQFLVFDGTTQLQHDCSIGKSRMKFKGEVDPLQIMIPVGEVPANEENVPVALGIMSTVDSTHIYSAFLSPQRARSDVKVITATGFLVFDKNSREYRISNKEKLVERSLPGNYIAFHTTNCTVTGEGKMNLGADLGQVVLMPIGNATNFSIADSTVFNMVMVVDFFFDDNCLEKMADAINANTALPPTDFSSTTFQRALTELMGKDKADKLITQYNLYGAPRKFPDELKYALFFNDLKMKWHQASKSYISVGKLGLGNINKNQINKFVDGKVQLERKRGGDVLHIYFELDGGNWYYFKYVNGVMTAISSNDAFNNIIKELKDEKRRKEAEKGGKPYRFILGNPADKGLFTKKMLRIEQSGEPGDGGGN